MSFSLPATLSVTFPNGYGANQSKVEVIKAIRTLTGIGLLEAKNLSEKTGSNIIDIISNHMGSHHMWEVIFDTQCKALRANGCDVGPAIYQVLQELRDLGAEALRLGEDEIANEILQMVLAEKLRRGY